MDKRAIVDDNVALENRTCGEGFSYAGDRGERSTGSRRRRPVHLRMGMRKV